MELKGEKVLVVGLGVFGGGVATMKWLAKQGAILRSRRKTHRKQFSCDSEEKRNSNRK
ncbi:MAG: hypothetical protein UW92_C0004G0014 [Candidatus Jorgensenbacteria bacterium GW2011_GWA2_45_13]|uniref:Uncharacterized protein n=1 Tax=Candidatus Jorgensenbacteria bacterium GW2011_GWA2_45_13 TaxID=1618662 RepID=A0A0G1L8G4_9BACT|nr:MAG: hypothetical protein UW92_C0004G0014 [Candidatus Jorgensenbacteria bacterium GW2011_GWA2_45_13]